jgi:hypothetical protein
LINAYTVDFYLPNDSYSVAVVNHYKGTTFGNKPGILPTLLALSIKFSATDISVTSPPIGIAIFFDGAEFTDDPDTD